MKNLIYREGLSVASLRYDEHDANLDALMHWSGAWTAGTYKKNEVVFYLGGIYICTATSTTDDPYNSADWTLISTVSGRGAMRLTTTPQAGPNVGAGFVALPFDFEAPFQLGIITDSTTGNITFDYPGIWQFSVNINIGFAQAQQGRTTNLRIWNVDDGTELLREPIYIGRNQDGVVFNTTFLDQIVEADAGDTVRFEIGGGADLSATTWETSAVYAVQLSAI